MQTSIPSILVVDDETDSCLNLRDILTDLGYRVDIAHNGAQALALVRQRGYDLALLDLKMPDMDGITLYGKMRQLDSRAVALVVTAFAGSGVREQAQAAGTWQVLSKPIDFPRLLQLVAQATRSCSTTQAAKDASP